MRIGMVGITSMYWPVAVARALVRAEGVELVAATALGSPEKETVETLGMSAREFADTFALKQYADAEPMIAAEELDAVVLNVRHSEHAEWAERLAALGVDIYIPKPFATTVAEARRITRAGKRHGVNIACGPSERYHPAILAARKAIGQGLIGEPFSMRMAHDHGTIDAFHCRDWYRDIKEGGPELSLGWYVVDLALHFMSGQVTRVSASYGNHLFPESPFMDCGKMVLHLNTEALVSCDMYFCNRFRFPVWELEVVGPDGAVKVQSVDGNAGKLAAWLFDAKGMRRLRLPLRPPDREVAWLEGFAKGVPAVVPASTALEITRISIAARDSAAKGRPVSLKSASG